MAFGIVALCVLSTAAMAQIDVSDNWDDRGEVVLTGNDWTAALSKDKAALAVTAFPTKENGAEQSSAMNVVPFADDGAEAQKLTACAVSAGRKGVEVHATFTAANTTITAKFYITKHGTIRVTPGPAMGGVLVRSRIEVGIMPGIRIEDVLYFPEKYTAQDEILVPAENWFAGLVHGRDGIIGCGWAEPEQQLRLLLSGNESERIIEAIKINQAGKDLYLELLSAPRIWHREKLGMAHLEKDVVIDWNKPFKAVYKTQLPLRAENTTVRTCRLHRERDAQFRPECGSHVWPLWGDEEINLHLSKKIPPKGDAIIYPIEEGDDSVMSFMLRTHIGRSILTRNKRKDVPFGSRDAANVGFVACGGTAVMRNSIFYFGAQTREKEFLIEYADFICDYVDIIQERNIAYYAMAEALRNKIETWKEAEQDNPALCGYLDKMMEHCVYVVEGHDQKMELYDGKTPEDHKAYAAFANKRLKELIDTDSREVFPECNHLIYRLNRLSWGHDETTGMRFSMSTRAWAQEAALLCVDLPGAQEYAADIRATIRDALNGAPRW